MNTGYFVTNYPIAASQLPVGQSITVWLAGEAFEATRTGAGRYQFTIKRCPSMDKRPR